MHETLLEDLLDLYVDIPIKQDPRPFVEDVEAVLVVDLKGFAEDEDDSFGMRVVGEIVYELLEEGPLIRLSHPPAEFLNLLQGGTIYRLCPRYDLNYLDWWLCFHLYFCKYK